MTYFKFRRCGVFLLSSLFLPLLMLSMLPAKQAFAQTHYTVPPVTAANDCGPTSELPKKPVVVTPPLRKDTVVTVTGEVTQGTGTLIVYDDYSGQSPTFGETGTVVSISNGQGPQTTPEYPITTNNDVLKACLESPSRNAIGKVTVNLPTPPRGQAPTPTPPRGQAPTPTPPRGQAPTPTPPSQCPSPHKCADP